MSKTLIKSIEVWKLNVLLKEPFRISLGEITAANNLVIKINTESGLSGTGECSALPYIVGEIQESQFEIARKISCLLKGKNPFAIEDRISEIDKALPGNYTIKSAFDMALYDLLAKKAGLPLYQVLGGENSREVYTDMTISLNTPEIMADKAVKYKEEGIRAIKVKLGTTAKEDIARIKAIREAIGYEIPLRIDANQGWDPVTAIKVLNELKPFEIDHCEEPVPFWDNRGLLRVRDNSPIPIMADESLFDHRDAFRLASMGACDYFNVKLSKSGGIHTALKIIAVAEASGIKCQVGCMNETRYALTALMHLVAARNNIVYFDIDSSFFQVSDPVIGGIEYQGAGHWILPDSPGIGAKFDSRILDKMEKIII
jgi:L-alanine-DL-glutamate epimerase-like enolase superfamily enzyme